MVLTLNPAYSEHARSWGGDEVHLVHQQPVPPVVSIGPRDACPLDQHRALGPVGGVVPLRWSAEVLPDAEVQDEVPHREDEVPEPGVDLCPKNQEADVAFVARGSHLEALRARGLQVRSLLGDFHVEVEATEDTALVGPVDYVLVGVKTYDNEAVIASLDPSWGEGCRNSRFGS